MTSDHGIHVGKPLFFDGNNYDYWKTRMSAHLKAMSRKLWRVVNDGYVICISEALDDIKFSHIKSTKEHINPLII